MTLTLAPETGARLLEAAARKGLAPDEMIDALLRQESNEEEIAAEAEQARLRDVFAQLQVKALALETEPCPDNPDQAPEERLFGEIITEKYRKQGFNLP